MNGIYAYFVLSVIVVLTICISFIILSCLRRWLMLSHSYAAPVRHGSIVAWVISVFANVADDAPWYLSNLPYLIAAVGVAIGSWGFTFSIISGEPLDFGRSGAIITLLGFVITFWSQSYAEKVYRTIIYFRGTSAVLNRADIISNAEKLSRRWGLIIVVPGTVIWAYGDLFSGSVERYACDHHWRLAIHCAGSPVLPVLLRPPPLTELPPYSVLPPPASLPWFRTPDRLLVLFDWGSSTLRPDSEQIIFQAAQDAEKEASPSVRLIGHADDSGLPERNRTLSENRATMVRAELIKLGLKSTEVTALSEGSGAPLVPSDSKVREIFNRSVEIFVYHGFSSAQGQ